MPEEEFNFCRLNSRIDLCGIAQDEWILNASKCQDTQKMNLSTNNLKIVLSSPRRCYVRKDIKERAMKQIPSNMPFLWSSFFVVYFAFSVKFLYCST